MPAKCHGARRRPSGPDSRFRLRVELLEARCLLAADLAGICPLTLTEPLTASYSVPAATDTSWAAADADGSFNTATNIGQLKGTSVQNGAVGATDLHDYYRFDVKASSALALSLDNLTNDVDLYLYDANGEIIDYSINGSTDAEQINRNVSAGTYYVLVTPYYSVSSTYRLTLTAAAIPNPDRADNSFETSRKLGTLSNTLSYSDSIGGRDIIDFLHFDVTTPGTVQASLTGTSEASSVLILMNTDGEVLRFASGDAPSFTTELTPDDYYLAVFGVDVRQYEVTLNFDSAATSPVDAFPNVPYFGGTRDWDLNAINAPEVWAQGYTGEGITVAVIDTGVDLLHADFDGHLWRNVNDVAGDGIDNDENGYVDDYYGWDFFDGDASPQDEHGHGTHVAGSIIAANNGVGSTGVAYGATVMPIRALGTNGSGSVLDIVAGIYYAVDNGANIINMSLGGESSSVYLQQALQYAAEKNVLVVAAAGNEGAPTPDWPARYSSLLNNVISVGAYSSNNQIASFSNEVGPTGAVQVDAPGVGIVSTRLSGGTVSMNGTSMATPHVAGLAALALSANPNLTAADLRNLIVEGANVAIAGSDGIGGINAAITVARAIGYQGGAAPTSAANIPSTGSSTRIGIRSLTASAVTWFDASPSPSRLTPASLDATGLAGQRAHAIALRAAVTTSVASSQSLVAEMWDVTAAATDRQTARPEIDRFFDAFTAKSTDEFAIFRRA